ncbi:hypothetical protein HELRODRAFT_184544 [Helobdella robusta]|uniref:Copper type II ascorbate-dependent monooxygenase N-terminal domain-containing protein n=1 Tax=Helobdella robusta TaxID=6412 RepID=T1FLF8_HELRO|nr:hypothetical protein HELRODRAFT_184544 [Helobdella robusta]ESN89990.1 hypothetical protein HELRODRAFT_184544 [Helobdella robusta]
MPVVHHILLYGCEVPGSDDDAWECGDMTSLQASSSPPSDQYKHAPVCGEGSKQSILYAWAMDAPKLQLPPNVGIQQPKKAGVYLLTSVDGEVGVRGTTHMEVACVMQEDRVIHPFAFRRVLSGYRIRDGVWTEIGRKDPRLPEVVIP